VGIDHGSKVEDRPTIMGGADQLKEFSGSTAPTGFGLTGFEVIGSNVLLSHTHATGEDVLML